MLSWFASKTKLICYVYSGFARDSLLGHLRAHIGFVHVLTRIRKSNPVSVGLFLAMLLEFIQIRQQTCINMFYLFIHLLLWGQEIITLKYCRNLRQN